VAVLSCDQSIPCEAGIDYYRVDLRDADSVNSVVREISPQQIYHLAGITSVAASWNNPRLTYEVNVFGAYNLFEAAARLPAPVRILNVSSCQVYAASALALSENNPLRPTSPYAASKAMAELLVACYRGNTGVITARPFNHSGPEQSATFVLPSIASQLAEVESGTRPPSITVGNLDVERDFSDVRDVVRAYSMLLNTGNLGETYNVCSGTAIRLADVIPIFESAVGFKFTVQIAQERVRSDDVARICGDSSKVRTDTGWFPQIRLEQTISDLMRYWRMRIRVEHPAVSS
jgi:GDP-4-dehydro-6-deoxy-D-mannose reductase